MPRWCRLKKSAELAHKNAERAQQRTSEISVLLKKNRVNVETAARGIATSLAETKDALAALMSLGEVGFRIERAVDKIVLVAVQTSMLAVSGSVEAARRPVIAGRGFALVSTDIRKLASDAAENIDGVREVVRAIQIQIAVVQRELELIVIASEAEIAKNKLILDRLNAVEVEVETINSGNKIILEASQAILSTTRQVQVGTQQIAAVAQQASAAAQQSAAAARQQSRGAEDLAAAIEEIASLADELQTVGHVM